jgi:hypothetical protein
LKDVSGYLHPETRAFYEAKICVTAEEALRINNDTIGQRNKPKWLEEKRRRITGSIARKIFTYSSNKSPDWSKKLNSIFYSRPPEAPIKHGIEFEPKALKALLDDTGSENYFEEMGLVIHPDLPWLGYSPDGFLKNREVLIEIKCPFSALKHNSMDELLNNLSYLKKELNGSRVLRQSHEYYTQIQLGMYILQVKKCIFCIYHSKMDEIWLIEVERNEGFIEQTVKKLKCTYFSIVLPFVLSKLC